MKSSREAPQARKNAFKKRYSQVYRSLGRAQLQQGAASLHEIDPAELVSTGSGLILDYYTPEGLEFALREYGLFEDIRRLGYESVRFEARRDDYEDHLIRIHSVLPSMREPLVELVIKSSRMSVRDELCEQLGDEPFTVLNVEWLQLQHPMVHFSQDRPPLPGQCAPGLGLSRKVLGLLRNTCRRLKLDALVTTPSYYHNAIFYEVGFDFIDPTYQGHLQAMKRDLAKRYHEDFADTPAELELAVHSWAIAWGEVMELNEEGTCRLEWPHEPMVSPVSKRLREYFASSWYAAEVERARHEVRYDWLDDSIRQELETYGIYPHDKERIDEMLCNER